MTGRRLLAAAVIALAFAIIPITRDTEAAVGLGLSTASCESGDCGHRTMMDCYCVKPPLTNHAPQCKDEGGK